MVSAPICGYAGDRCSRKIIMAVGLLLWSCTILWSSFLGQQHLWVFILARALVGIGEASFSTVAPTIIADLFKGDQRSIMLMVFYFAIPVGSGFGYVVGSEVSNFMQSWKWGIRLTPICGCIFLLLLVLVLREPQRGHSELVGERMKRKTMKQSLIYLAKNKSFVLTTMGFVCVSSVSGSLSLWMPAYIRYWQMIQGNETTHFILLFGVITCVAGFVGVSVGSIWTTRWRRTNMAADPLVCASGMLLSLPFFFIAINIWQSSAYIVFSLLFMGIVGLCLNWAIVSDILMYVVVPVCRSTGNAVQLFFGHLLGDAISPSLLGLISDLVRDGRTSSYDHFHSLRYALYMPAFVLVFGAMFFFSTAWFIEVDKRKADEAVKGAHATVISTMFSDMTEESKKSAIIPEDNIRVETADVHLSVYPQTLTIIHTEND